MPDRALHFVSVPGTRGAPYPFGHPANGPSIAIPDFFIGITPVTQTLWGQVMDTNPACHQGPHLPMENISWEELTAAGGFLDRLNQSSARTETAERLGLPNAKFRLPTETEWEYAARGGPHWQDNFEFSGSNDIDAVAWHDRKHGDHTQPVALKAPNQLGLYDLSGNVWEWCQDVFTENIRDIPRNGTPHTGSGAERVLRGGCFHNWAIHCTVSKRYQIESHCHDGCIGFRLVFA